MTPVTSIDFDSYLPVYDTVPETWQEGRQFLIEVLKKISNAVNIREIGFFLDEELLSGKQFIPGVNNNQEFRTVLRKVVDFGPLPNAMNKQVPHGITIDANFTLIGLYAVATNPTALTSFAIPHATTNPMNVVQIFLDSTFINIEDLVDYTAFTRVFVVIHYLQEL